MPLSFKNAILSIWSYQRHVRYLRESKICLFYSYATAKNEIQTCSNEHDTGLVDGRTSLLCWQLFRQNNFKNGIGMFQRIVEETS